MFMRVIIEFHVIRTDATDVTNTKPSQPVLSSTSDTLKAIFNAELEEVGGFENWRQSIIAERMLDDSDSVFASISGEDNYLLVGNYEDEIVSIFIDWEQGEQPRVQRVEHKRVLRVVK
jgi:hypothetical protein